MNHFKHIGKGDPFGPGNWRKRDGSIVDLTKDDGVFFAFPGDDPLWCPQTGKHWTMEAFNLIEPADDKTAERYGWVPVVTETPGCNVTALMDDLGISSGDSK